MCFDMSVASTFAGNIYTLDYQMGCFSHYKKYNLHYQGSNCISRSIISIINDLAIKIGSRDVIALSLFLIGSDQ